MSRARSLARERAMQALYQWQMTGQDLSDIEQQFISGQEMKGVDKEYFKELLHQVPRHIAQFDEICGELLSRPIEQVDPVERAILRIGLYELKQRIDIPYRVVINEAVELAKGYGAEAGHKFINGTLDKAAKSLREVEMKAAGRK
ncbi:MAG: transcription antitermination factor NusB [Chromatiales bacterium]|nr:transcription antitermination factor NusB [Chromatiales bacterium]